MYRVIHRKRRPLSFFTIPISLAFFVGLVVLGFYQGRKLQGGLNVSKSHKEVKRIVKSKQYYTFSKPIRTW